MSRADRFDFTLDEETEKRLYDLMTDIDTRITNRFQIKDKRGYHAEYVKVIQCKNCKHWDKPHGWNGWCCKNRILAEADDFCSWAERKEE